jgi:alkylation response protein AidB-like acyl-CoA dehydrogenase
MSEALSTRIRFTDEQAMLLDTATAFCREKSPVAAVRAQLTSVHGFDRAIWDEMVALGWSGIAVPESFGGSGLSLAEVATIAEPMGRHLLATPFASTQLAIQALLAGGSDAQQADWLPRLAAGAIGTVALFERDGDWDLARPQASATPEGERVRLGGVKTLVCDAAVADLLVVSVALHGAPALALVRADELPSGSLQRETVIDETRRCERVTLDGIHVPATAMITGEAAARALQAIDRAAWLIASAEAAGGIAGALGVIVEYLNLRTAFGRKIGAYQSLKHTCAEILVGLERARSHMYHAATLLADGQDAEIALRMAKVEAGDTFVLAGDRAIQFHGGFGFTYECDGQLYLRRALWLQYAHGDAPAHRRRLAAMLLERG